MTQNSDRARGPAAADGPSLVRHPDIPGRWILAVPRRNRTTHVWLSQEEMAVICALLARELPPAVVDQICAFSSLVMTGSQR
jgi:hypothetical protein